MNNNINNFNKMNLNFLNTKPFNPNNNKMALGFNNKKNNYSRFKRNNNNFQNRKKNNSNFKETKYENITYKI